MPIRGGHAQLGTLTTRGALWLHANDDYAIAQHATPRAMSDCQTNPPLPDPDRRRVLMRSAQAAGAVLLGCLSQGVAASATDVTLPLAIPYGMVRAQLAERVFIEPKESLHALSDASGCNKLKLSAPRVEAAPQGELRITLRVDARGGTPVASACVLPFTWSGVIELRESAYVGNPPSAIAFRVRDSNILDKDGHSSTVPGMLWGWLKQYVQPPMEAFTFDLAPLLGSTHELIVNALAAAPTFATASANTLVLRSVKADSKALVATLAFELPEVNPAALPALPHTPLNAQEMMVWDAQWQYWDAFATWAIKTVAAGANGELRGALSEVLLEARYELRDALANDALAADPVRSLFVHTWERLAPLLAAAELNVDSASALRYMALINAGDALRALDNAGAQFGLRIDQQTLRQLARLLLPGVTDEDLAYSIAPDPALRELLGFTPEFAAAAHDIAPRSWFAWLVANAVAGEVNSAALAHLNQWLPQDHDLDAYLAAMEALLADIAKQEQQRGKVAAPYLDVYRTLLRATAWQETCWRQYVKENGRVEPLRSSAGSIGLMQINQHVWRGVYDTHKLAADIGYNAHAGNEILVHYLVDFAIKNKEHEISHDVNALARATYAVYNGGPGHLQRYRNPHEPRELRAIDAAFWNKYQTLRSQGVDAVKQCYAQ